MRAVLMSAAEVKAILEEYLYSTNNIYDPVVSMYADSGLISRITKVADAAARTGSWDSPGLSALRYEISKAYNDTRIKQSDAAIDNNVKDPGERERLKYTAHRVLAMAISLLKRSIITANLTGMPRYGFPICRKASSMMKIWGI